jgi:integrase/recombinase XerD
MKQKTPPFVITPQMLTAFEAFLATQRCVSPNTYAAYLRDVRQLKAFQDTHKKLAPRELFMQFREQLYDQGVGARSIARKLSAFRCFFKFMRERFPRKIPDNILEMLGHLPRLEKRLPRICSPDEIKALLAHAYGEGEDGERNRLICTVLYTTGLRVSELVALKVSQIDTTDKVLRISGKGGKTRLIPLLPSTYELLFQYIMRRETKNFLFYTMSPNHPLSRQTAWRIIRAVAQRAGIAHTVSPHILRHSLATHSLEHGWDLRSLQMLLGHERIATTEHYIHLDTAYVKKEYRKRHPRG